MTRKLKQEVGTTIHIIGLDTEEIYRQGFREGFRQGFREGFRQGLAEARAELIFSMITTCIQLKATDEQTIDMLYRGFNLTKEEEALDWLKRYSDSNVKVKALKEMY